MSDRSGYQRFAPPVVDLLTASFEAFTELLAGQQTGMRWRRPPRECPDWCTRDHRCTAKYLDHAGNAHYGYPGGEHRSPTTLWTPPYGQLQATRIRTVHGDDRIELAETIRLHPDPHIALLQGIQLPGIVNLAIKTTLAQVAYIAAPATRPQLALTDETGARR